MNLDGVTPLALHSCQRASVLLLSHIQGIVKMTMVPLGDQDTLDFQYLQVESETIDIAMPPIETDTPAMILTRLPLILSPSLLPLILFLLLGLCSYLLEEDSDPHVTMQVLESSWMNDMGVVNCLMTTSITILLNCV